MGEAPLRGAPSVQQYPVSGDQLFTTYLMFGRHSRLLINFYFPTWGAFEHSCHVPKYVDKIRHHFKEAYTEAHIQTNLEADQQKQNYDRATSTVQLVLGDAVLLKQDAFQGKRKMKDRWGNEVYEVVRQVAPDMPTYKVCESSTETDFSWWPPSWSQSHP